MRAPLHKGHLPAPTTTRNDHRFFLYFHSVHGGHLSYAVPTTKIWSENRFFLYFHSVHSGHSVTDHIANMVPVQTMTGGFGRVQWLVVLADVGDSLMPPSSVARGVTDYDHTLSVRRRVTA